MSRFFKEQKKVALLLVLMLLFNTTGNVFASSGSSNIRPTGYIPLNTQPINIFQGLIQMSNNPTILLIEDLNPWGATAHHNMLQSMGELKKISSNEALLTDFSRYDIVILSNDQLTSTYENYILFKSALEQYVEDGGVLIFGASDRGWNNGALNYDLPGGLRKINDYRPNNKVSDDQHYVVTGELSDNNSLTNSDLVGNYASHTSFVESTIPFGSDIILRDDKGLPTLVEYRMGYGRVIASGLTWEHNLEHGNTFSGKALDDLYLYSIFSSSNGVYFNVSPATGFLEDTVDLTVSIRNNPGISGFSFELGFDNDYIKPVEFITSGSAVSAVYTNLTEGSDKESLSAITAVWSNSSNIDVDGNLFTVRLEIKPNAYTGAYPITLTGMVVNDKFEEIEYGTRQGILYVSDGANVMYGDIYTDNFVDIKDAVKMSQFLAEKIALTTYETFAADVHKNDVIDIRDAIKLSQYLAGHEGIELGSPN